MPTRCARKSTSRSVRSREIYDPALNFQLSNDFHVRRVIRNYLPNDEESCHCACLLQWDNIYYEPPKEQNKVERRPTVRIGLVQWQMRNYKDIDDLVEQAEFFVDSVSSYKADFILFPEYFNAPLMAPFNKMGEAQSIRALAQYTEKIRDRFRELAISYNINIITGSMPFIKDDGDCIMWDSFAGATAPWRCMRRFMSPLMSRSSGVSARARG